MDALNKKKRSKRKRSKKALSTKQKKQLNMNDIPPEQQKYVGFDSLHVKNMIHMSYSLR